jgi:hypothetical protein
VINVTLTKCIFSVIINSGPTGISSFPVEVPLLESTTLACPRCSSPLQVPPDLKRFTCHCCSAEHVIKRSGRFIFLNPIEAELLEIQERAVKKTARLAIKKLKAEVKNLEVELQELEDQGSPLDIVRTVGFAVIALGLLLSLIYGIGNISVLTMAASGIAVGIVLHGSTEFFGKDYYLHKAYLQELIKKKRGDILKYEHDLSCLDLKHSYPFNPI